jgi:hypothetical protein
LLVASRRRNLAEFSRATRVAYRQCIRYRKEGVTPEAAMTLCDRLGLHPCEVWGSWIDDWKDDVA